MSTANRQELRALYLEALQHSGKRLRLSHKTCHSCPLKPLCYHDKKKWEDIRQLDLLQIRNSCPIKSHPRHEDEIGLAGHEK